MHIQVEKLGPYLRKLSITVAAEEVDAAFEQYFRKVSKSVRLPGFRPGKIPRALLEKRFAAEAPSEVSMQLVEDSLYKAIVEHNLPAVTAPRLQLAALERGSAFSYTAEVEVKPDIDLKKWRGLNVPKVDTGVSEEAVTRELDKLREGASNLVPVAGRDVAQQGDVVLADYAGFVGGEPFDGGKADNALIELGSGGYIPGFTEGLVGATVPSEKTIQVTFPADYPRQDLAGKEAEFRLQLKELKVKELPAADDEFAKDRGADSLQALRQSLHDQLTTRATGQAQSIRRKAVLDQLVAENPLEIPPSMVAAQTDRVVAEAQERIQQMTGQKVQLSAAELAQLRGDAQSDAHKQVASALLLEAVGQRENITISDAEVEQEIAQIAQSLGDQAVRVQAYYAQQERRDGLRYRLLENRVIDFLIQSGVETDAPVGAVTAEGDAASTTGGG